MIRLRLKEVLEQKHVTQSKLSRMSDVSVNTIHDMIRNPYTDVRINTLDKIATALDMEISDLYVRETRNEPGSILPL
jgi:DNA-binding Xre family transcriptional regulator